MKTKRLFLHPFYLILISLLIHPTLSGQTNHINQEEEGYSFKIPDDWKYQLLDGGIHMMGHLSTPGFIIVMSHEVNDLATLKQIALSEGLQDDGVHLQVVNGVLPFRKNGMQASLEGYMNYEQIKVHSISLISPNGGGFIILSGTTTEKYNPQYAQLTESVAQSVKFSKPKMSSDSQKWFNKLNGNKLTYYNTSNYTSNTTTIYLYTNQTFYYSNNFTGSSRDVYGDFSMAGNNKDAGTWKVKNDGSTSYLVLHYKGLLLTTYHIYML